MEKIKVVICDDQQDILDYFCDILNTQEDIIVIGRAKNGEEAIRTVMETRPDIVLMDIQMDSEYDGITAIERISDEMPDVKSVVLTIHDNDEIIINAYIAGAIDYIIKTTAEEELCQTIRNVYNNDNYIGKIIENKMRCELKSMKANQKSLLFVINELTKLTPSERDILKCLCNGKKQREIAKERCIELGTVKFHVTNILKKLHLKNTKELRNVLKELGLLETDFKFLNNDRLNY